MVDVATLQIKVDTKDLARGEASLEALQREGLRTEKVVDQLGNTAQRTGARVRTVGGSAGAAGRQFQNAAFQVGDFATQMASGQRASVALAQQLPQLLGGFGVLGAVLGAVVAIGGALVPVLFNIGDGAKDAASGVDDLNDAVDALDRALDAFSAKGLQSAVDKYGELNAEILLLLERQRKLAESDALAKATAAVAAFRDEYVETLFRTDIANIGDLLGVEATIVQIDNFGNKIRTINPEVRAFQENLLAIETAKTFEAQADAAATLLTQLEGTEAETSDVYRNLVEAEAALRRLAAESERASGPLAVFAEIAATIRDRFVEAVEAASKLPGAGGPESSPRPRARPIDWLPGDGGNRPTGGGSSVDTFARELDALQNSLRSQREIADAWYNESQAILADRRAMEILSEQDHREALLRVEEEYQGRLRDIRLSEQDRTLGYTAQFFGAMAQATAAGGDKMAKAAAVFGAVEATVNAYRAAAQALADPSVPFWGKAAAYASVLATGLQAVSAIKGAGSGGGAATTAPTAAPIANTSPRVAITLQGETFSAAQVRDLINAINQEVEAGAIVRLA
jgi:ElaB/YqjD/DUF883 family membrane-anchored ribosome-binding protein